MKILCTSNVAMAREAFSTIGTVEVLSDQQISPSAVREADVLVVRSRISVDRDLLEGSNVSFVGTATAGTDHIDLSYLEEAGIAWCAAAGCNANSVVEYFVTALHCLAHRKGLVLEGMTLGIVGAGHVGSLVAKVGEALGMKVLMCDPPLKMNIGKASLISLRKVLRQADIVTLHVPLVHTQPHPTSYMANHRFFRELKPGCILVNTSRGEIIDSDALLLALQRGVVSSAVLDVWDNEPFYPKDLLAAVDLATSHIAGHSLEGKVQGTLAVYEEVCHFLEVEPTWDPRLSLPPPPVAEVEIDAQERSDDEVIWQILRKIYDIEKDDRALRASAVEEDAARAANFIRLHLDYPVRREFTNTCVKICHERPELIKKIASMGFRVQCVS